MQNCCAFSVPAEHSCFCRLIDPCPTALCVCVGVCLGVCLCGCLGGCGCGWVYNVRERGTTNCLDASTTQGVWAKETGARKEMEERAMRVRRESWEGVGEEVPRAILDRKREQGDAVMPRLCSRVNMGGYVQQIVVCAGSCTTVLGRTPIG